MRHFASRIIFAFCLFLSFLLMLYTVPGYSFAFFKYVAYLFFAVYLPGAFFFYKLCGRRLALLESLAVGVPLGLGIEFLIAMFSVMIHFRSFIFFLPVLGLGLFLLAVFRNKSQAWLPEYDLGILEACLVGSCIFGILYTIEHRGFMYTALISSAFSENHNIDALYNLGTIAEIKNHWPLQDPRMAGLPYYYHYFLFLHIVAVNFVARVSLDLVLFRLIIFLFSLVFGSQIFLLGKKVIRSWYGGALAVWICCFLEQPVKYGNDFILYLYTSSTFFPGIIYFTVMALTVPQLMFKKNILSIKKLIFLAIISLAGCASKGSVGPLVISSLGLVFIIDWLVQKKINFHLIIIGVVVSLSFVISYFVIFGGLGSKFTQAELQAFTHFYSTTFYSDRFSTILNIVEKIRTGHSVYVSTKIALLITFIIYMFGYFGVRLCAVTTLFFLKKLETERLYYVLVLWCFVIACLSFSNAFQMTTHTEYYFLFPVQVPISVLAAFGIFLIIERFKNSKKGLVFLFVIGGLVLIQTGYWWTYNQMWHEGWKLRGKQLESSQESALLFEGLYWVRDHTSTSDVIISNLFTESVSKNVKFINEFPKASFYFYYSALAERRVFLEGWSYRLPAEEWNKRLKLANSVFQDNDLVILSDLKQNYHVSIVFVDKRWPSQFDPLLARAKLLFSNKLVEVYQI